MIRPRADYAEKAEKEWSAFARSAKRRMYFNTIMLIWGAEWLVYDATHGKHYQAIAQGFFFIFQLILLLFNHDRRQKNLRVAKAFANRQWPDWR